MDFRSRPVLTATSAALLAFVAACGDDPARPPGEVWRDAALPNLGAAGLINIAARGSRVVAIGAAGSETEPEAVALETTGGAWQVLPLPATPVDALFLGLALDPSGSAVLVGARPAGEPLVLDERVGWQTATLPVAGFLNAVAAGQGSTWVAVGTASGGFAAWSSVPGVWVTDHAGFTTPQEKGLVDVSHADGVFVACGWDDADLGPALRRDDGTGWKNLLGPGSVTIPEAHAEYRSVLLESGGALWLGGTIVEAMGSDEVYTALLARRPPSGDWFEIVLPDAASAEAVNDILRAADGSVYLACGETAARVLRFDGARWHDEGPGTPGQILALAEDASGRIYAAGVSAHATAQPQPLLRVRRP